MQIQQPGIKYFIPAIIYFFITLYLFTIPGKQLPSAEWLNFIYADKWVHMGLFCILQITWCWPYTQTSFTSLQLKKTFVTIALVALLYGIVIEFVQKYYIPNRSFDGFDIVADGLGAGFGCVFSIQVLIK